MYPGTFPSGYPMTFPNMGSYPNLTQFLESMPQQPLFPQWQKDMAQAGMARFREDPERTFGNINRAAEAWQNVRPQIPNERIPENWPTPPTTPLSERNPLVASALERVIKNLPATQQPLFPQWQKTAAQTLGPAIRQNTTPQGALNALDKAAEMYRGGYNRREETGRWLPGGIGRGQPVPGAPGGNVNIRGNFPPPNPSMQSTSGQPTQSKLMQVLLPLLQRRR